MPAKREVPSSSTTASMAPLKGKHAGSPGHGDRVLPVIPTPELQELYDEYRRAEEELDLDARIALQAEQNPSDANAHLHPQTPPQSTTMSRSPSCASYTSNNIGNTHTNNDIRENTNTDARKKRRAIRHGPLDKVTKARAAFVRKLGACPECRGRKVKCNHYDLSPFKKSYDSRKDTLLRASLAEQANGHQSATLVSSATHFQGSFLQPRTMDMALRGVSANPATTPFQVSSQAVDTAEQDPDILSQLLPVLRNTATFTSHPQSISPLGPPWFPLSSRNSSLMLSSGTFPVASVPGPAHEDRLIAIGRQISDVHDEWECQRVCNSDGTESPSSFNEEGPMCLQYFRGLSKLCAHYQAAHGPFREAQPPFFWKCKSCGFLGNDRWPVCPQCQHVQPDLEKWYYGSLIATDSVASPPASSVSISDQASMFGTSLGSFSSHSFSGFHSLSSPGWYSSPGSGNGGSFFQRFPGEMAAVFRCSHFISRATRQITLSSALSLVLAFLLQVQSLLSTSMAVIAGCVEELATYISTGSARWSGKSRHIGLTISVMVFLLMAVIGRWALGPTSERFIQSKRNAGYSRHSSALPRRKADCIT